METYTETVGMLSQQCQHLLELGHPERFAITFMDFILDARKKGLIKLVSLHINSEQITKQQSHIDRLYVSLKDMVEHRKTKLEQQYWLYQLKKDVDELEKWITEREAVATSTELGHDLEDVTVRPFCTRHFVANTLMLSFHISSLNMLLRNIRNIGTNYNHYLLFFFSSGKIA